MAHTTAKLTPFGRRLLWNGFWCSDGRWPPRPRRSRCPDRPRNGTSAGCVQVGTFGPFPLTGFQYWWWESQRDGGGVEETLHVPAA